MRPVFVLTGATGGIGAAAAEALTELDVHLVLVGRDPDKVRALVERFSGRVASVEGEVADLGLLAEIRALAARLIHSHDRVHALLHNAGVYRASREETAEGYERMFAVNVVGPFLLTVLLKQVLLQGAPSRVVFVASDAHRGQLLDFSDLQSTEWPLMGGAAYGRSKLAVLLVARELARRLEGTGVTSNAMHPGVVRTGIAADNGVLAALAAMVLAPISRSPTRGADTLVWLAHAAELDGVSGSYFMDRTLHPLDGPARDDDAARRLWNDLERLCGVSWQST
jgi:NAD(P)-dependent dehydrogenase (short-subunit alcohol dehydrogenase family)